MTPAKRNEGIQHRERQTSWSRGHIALTEEQFSGDRLIGEVGAKAAGTSIYIMEAQLFWMMKRATGGCR